jgi:hypothetical protein
VLSSRSESARRSSPRRRAIRAGLTSPLLHVPLAAQAATAPGHQSTQPAGLHVFPSGQQSSPDPSSQQVRSAGQEPKAEQISQHLSSTETQLRIDPSGQHCQPGPGGQHSIMSPALHITGPQQSVPCSAVGKHVPSRQQYSLARVPELQTSPPFRLHRRRAFLLMAAASSGSTESRDEPESAATRTAGVWLRERPALSVRTRLSKRVWSIGVLLR